MYLFIVTLKTIYKLLEIFISENYIEYFAQGMTIFFTENHHII